MKVLISSDLHLSKKIWRHRPILMDSYWSFRYLMRQAEHLQVDAVILAGDLLDKQANYAETLHELRNGLLNLQRHEIPVYYIQGQHEYQVMPWFDLFPNTHWLHQRTVELGGAKFVGCDYRDRDGLQAFLSSKIAKSADVLVCHQVWNEFLPVGNPQGSFDDIPEDVAYLITGDFHETISMDTASGLTVLSPGSTHLRSVAEPEDKFFFVMTIDDDGNVDTQKHSIPTRRMVTVDLSTSYVEDEVIADVAACFSGINAYCENNEMPDSLYAPIIRVFHAASSVEFVNTLTNSVQGKAHVFSKILVPSSRRSKDPKESVVKGAVGGIVAFSSYLPEFLGDSREEVELAHRLMYSSQPVDELELWFNSKQD